jgi:hypothetical protein
MRRLLVLVAASALSSLGCTSSNSSSHQPPPPIPSTYPDAPLGTPVVGLYKPSHVVSDGQDLYVTAGGGQGGAGVVERIPLDGGAPTAYAAPNPWAVAVDDTYVYWTDQRPAGNDGGAGRGMVRRMPKGGGAAETLAESNAPLDLAVDGTNVYWLGDRVSILSIPKDATDASATTVIAFDGGLLNGIALDATHVYWTEVHSVASWDFRGSVGRAPKTGGAPETLAVDGFGSLVAPASDDGGVYFAMFDFDAGHPGRLLRFDTQTNATTPTGASSDPSAIFSDGRYVYWTDSQWGIFAAPVSGGATIRVASCNPNAFPLGLTVVNGVIYWAAFGENAIRSIRGPAAP